MTLESYSLVELLTDLYQDRGVSIGAIGTILEVYEDGFYEVEFSQDDGTTVAWLAVSQDEIKPFVENNLVSVPAQRSHLIQPQSNCRDWRSHLIR
jgi:Domain of unknown function (DUF4926)